MVVGALRIRSSSNEFSTRMAGAHVYGSGFGNLVYFGDRGAKSATDERCF